MNRNDVRLWHEERSLIQRHVNQIGRKASKEPPVAEVFPDAALRRMVDRELEVARQPRKLRFIGIIGGKKVLIFRVDFGESTDQIPDVGSDPEIPDVPNVDDNAEGHGFGCQAVTVPFFQLYRG